MLCFLRGVGQGEILDAGIDRRSLKKSYLPVIKDLTMDNRFGAFVFLVNRISPVRDLSSQQIKDIYQNKITNWQDLGGEDLEITAYQRNKNSGSQELMENVFMRGEPLPEVDEAKIVT